jgi:hypothetical protein
MHPLFAVQVNAAINVQGMPRNAGGFNGIDANAIRGEIPCRGAHKESPGDSPPGRLRA